MKEIINDIVWYIPFKKLRNAVREYLYILAKNNNYKSELENIKSEISNIKKECNEISKLENIKLELINIKSEIGKVKKERNDYTDFYYLVKNEIVSEAVKYYLKYASNAKIFPKREQLFDFIFKEYLDKDEYKNKLFLEFGVWKGDSINYISNIFKDVMFYGFDSFEGLPENSGFWIKGSFDEKGILPNTNDNVKLIKGYFNDTLPIFLKEHKEKVAFIHVDCDLYSSTKTIFDNLYNRIEKGTIIEFDEYYCYVGWEHHEYKAFQDFCKKYNVKYEYIATHFRSGAGRMSVRILSIDN